jgi:hypothetical protein
VSLLTIIQQACGELSLTVPTVVVGSTDPQVIQLLALAQRAGQQIAQAHPWQALMAEKTFTTVASTEQPAALPTDFDRFIPNSFNNRTTRRPIIGPVTPQQWQWLIAQPAYSTIYLMYRERAGKFLIGPPTVAPPAGQTIAYEYISKNWAKSASGTPQSQFLADTDTTYLDEQLFVVYIIWAFLRAKGMSYAEEMETFNRNLEQQQARDGGSTRLLLSPRPLDLNRVNLPDGSFPSA